MTAPINDLALYEVALDSLKTYPNNPRVGNIDAIAESLQVNGQFRPIVVRKETGEILAGNHTWKAAKKLAWPTIKVTYVEGISDADAARIVLADNRIPELGTYDPTALLGLLESTPDLTGTGFDANFLDSLLDDVTTPGDEELPTGLDFDDENKYTSAVNIPQYNPTGEQPATPELYDDTKTKNLRARISSAHIPDDIKNFLSLAATRHIVFNYAKIAEFYAHASAEVQRLFEESALVIIDIDDAIRHGYVSFSETIAKIQERDKSAD